MDALSTRRTSLCRDLGTSAVGGDFHAKARHDAGSDAVLITIDLIEQDAELAGHGLATLDLCLQSNTLALPIGQK